jgi:hypothetical protein
MMRKNLENFFNRINLGVNILDIDRGFFQIDSCFFFGSLYSHDFGIHKVFEVICC